jgi:hypothetical protein
VNSEDDPAFRALLDSLDPKARDDLRRVPIRELYGWPQTFVSGDRLP